MHACNIYIYIYIFVYIYIYMSCVFIYKVEMPGLCRERQLNVKFSWAGNSDPSSSSKVSQQKT